MSNYNVAMGATASAGTQGEGLMMAMFRAAGYEVTDVSKDRSCQPKGFDFIAKDPKTGVETRYEVKSDQRMWKTGNLFAETEITRPNEHVQKGWFYTSQTQVLIYIDTVAGIAYFFAFPQLREWVLDHRDSLRPSNNTPNPYDKDSKCSGILVPVWRILRDAPECLLRYRVVNEAQEIAFPERLAGT